MVYALQPYICLLTPQLDRLTQSSVDLHAALILFEQSINKPVDLQTSKARIHWASKRFGLQTLLRTIANRYTSKSADRMAHVESLKILHGLTRCWFTGDMVNAALPGLKIIVRAILPYFLWPPLECEQISVPSTPSPLELYVRGPWGRNFETPCKLQCANKPPPCSDLQTSKARVTMRLQQSSSLRIFPTSRLPIFETSFLRKKTEVARCHNTSPFPP